jgi:DNA-binding beta-propeller fold protein YncE
MPTLPLLLVALLAPQDEPAPFQTFVRQVVDLSEPASCALAPDGVLYVLEALPARVRRYDAAGQEKARFGAPGSEPGRMLDPGDLELLGEHLFVADSGNHRVQVLTTDGQPVRAFGGFGRDAGQFNDPRGLDVSSAQGGRVAVADSRNDRIQVFDLEGKPLLAFGSFGHGDGELALPVDVCFDADGNLYVVDADNHRIQKFDAQGRFVKRWGDFGPYPGLFVAPAAIDFHDGLLYVTDTDNSRIQVFDTQGERVYEWGLHSLRPREGDGWLHYPSHAKIAPAGDLAVVIERFENRLQIFRRVRGDDPETLARIDNLILAHYGGSLDAAGGLLALVEPARPEVQIVKLVNGAPFKLANVETHGRRAGQLLRPVDAALDVERGRLYCSDPGNMRLSVFGFDPRAERELGFDRRMLRLVLELDFQALFEHRPEGMPATQWPIEPGALELDREGRLHMTDPRNRTVWAFGEDFSSARRYGGPETLARPVDLAFAKDGRLLVVDELAHALVVFGRDGALERSACADVLLRPAGICVDRDGNVFLSDAGRHRVHRLDAALAPATAWGRADDQPGLGPLEFYKPTGLTCDADGQIIVLDYGNHRGQVVSAGGEFRYAFGPKLFVGPANKP